MAKRAKRAKKSIESIKREIEEHFLKFEEDIQENNFDRGRYHATEMSNSLFRSLEAKIKILGIEDNSIKSYKERLKPLRKELGMTEED